MTLGEGGFMREQRWSGPRLIPIVVGWLAAGALGAAGASASPGTARVLPQVVSEFPGVPDSESEGFELLYQVEIPASGASFHTSAVPYSIDRRAETEGHFDRVAYHLLLEMPDEPEPRMMWASVNAFTTDRLLLGVPIEPLGAVFQRDVDGLNVFSNVDGVPTGTGLSGANIELWPHNYGAANSAGVPGASGDVYDTGDQPVEPVAGYGSMQLHHHGSGTTLLAWNRWGTGGATDLGIGNSPEGNPDWTFRMNSGDYVRRVLTVLVRSAPEPELTVEGPAVRSIHQRDASNAASVPVFGAARADVESIEARGLPIAPSGGSVGPPTDWVSVAEATGGRFSGVLRLPAGWYAVEVRAVGSSGPMGQRMVQPIGVGEVFVTAGQSNSANHGATPLAPVDECVSAVGPGGWRRAGDPQPIATGSGGSPWPPLGDALAEALDVPIGFVSVGWGGTSIGQWQPGGTLYPRLENALDLIQPNGARAVLWHQGESDAQVGTSEAEYAARLSKVIITLRDERGIDIPWGVARASYLPGLGPERLAAVIAGQNAVIASDDLVFAGPETDDLLGGEWRYDNVHFNEVGLREHAARWSAAVLGWMEDERLIPTPATATPTMTATSRPTVMPPPPSGTRLEALGDRSART